MKPKLSLKRLIRLSALLGLGACGGRQAIPDFDPTVTPLSPPLPLAQVFVLESWGSTPTDTVVTFHAGEDRTIVLRREAPDFSLFTQVKFPANSLKPPSGDSVTVRLSTPPGLYGVDIITEAEAQPGVQMSFSYGMHFVAPAGARDIYGSEIRFEQFLGVGRIEGDSTLVFLDSWRPASDLLMATIPGPGRYLVAAPRNPPGFKAIVF
jgi:hypothetical protein